MTNTRMDTRVESMESELKTLKEDMKRLPVVEHGIATLVDQVQQMRRAQEELMKELAGGDKSFGENGLKSTETLSSTRVSGREKGSWERPDFRARKIESPIFEGEDPDSWTYRAERFFTLNRLNNAEKLEAAVVCLEGDALNWFRWEDKRRKITNWEELKSLLLRRFRNNQEGSMYDRFLGLKQETTVKEYRKQFEMLAASLEQISEPVLESTFVKGLKSDIKGELRVLEPNGLEKTMDLAQKVEDKINIHKEQKRGSGFFRNNGLNPNNLIGDVPKTNERGAAAGERRGGYRRLTDAELQAKRAKGLCYRCDEKYSIGHRCKKPELQVLVKQEEELDDNEEVEEVKIEAHDVQTESQTVEVSLKSVVGLTPPKTMKMTGNINGLAVMVLVDSGASHNFITKEVVQKLNLSITPTEAYGVQMG